MVRQWVRVFGDGGGRSGRRASAAVAGVLVVALSACGQGPSAGGSSGGAARPGEDGSIAENSSISPFDAEHVAIRKLDPDLVAAVRKAAEDARSTGVELRVTSGWRSKEYQQRLLDRAVTAYGSLEEARRLVSTPEKSAHVSGKAIDIGPTDAADWLGRNGAEYGLCQVYANEMWHFELLTSPGGECPEQRNDAAG
ncbi:M15 family metallopeptidase [Saccharothrix australiensis]|uniref:D-alanyl-D-alanine carboxypeptidase-like protein n=1 Tax=Saccharothrix australiensis TaxID=2072 RepID=A0A495VYR7_9PSEU|nr:M15 family metallopeptidase [Saccharothrix australiensis]RKT53713.1 D-alanyl-D-alanine carboxypeptidase-like protein [Saccharothrix australiensis]